MVSYLLANGLTVNDDYRLHLIELEFDINCKKSKLLLKQFNDYLYKLAKMTCCEQKKAGNHFNIRICDVNTNPYLNGTHQPA